MGRNINKIDTYTFYLYSVHPNIPNYLTDTGAITRLVIQAPDSTISMPSL